MSKKEFKVYLETRDHESLRNKALSMGISGRGWLTHLFERIANTDIAVIDNNLKKVLSLFELK